MSDDQIQRARGRPRAFDEVGFLDAVIKLFRVRGFAGVSLSEITAASGLTVGSIYKAYGDKEGLFDAALSRYIDIRAEQNHAHLADLPNARDKIAKLLEIYIDLSRGSEGALGCMVVSGVTDLELLARVGPHLRTQLKTLEASLRDLICAGQSDGSIALTVNPDNTATLLLSMLQGLRLLGQAGLVNDANPESLKLTMLKILE